MASVETPDPHTVVVTLKEARPTFLFNMGESTAVVVNPEAGAAYLGTQGDEFDAQKDMALAALGAMIALAGVSVLGWTKR